MRFQTANDVTKANKLVEMQVAPLDENIRPIILDNCPPALTVGGRCTEQGWGFYWPPYSAPVFVKPCGKIIKHIVKNSCPYIIDSGMKSYAMPSVSSTSPARVADQMAERADGALHDESDKKSAEVKPVSDEDLEEPLTRIERLKLEARSLDHLLTHVPKNPYCPACQRAKMQAAPCLSRANRQSDSEPPKREFGSQVTADHFIAHDEFDSSI